MKLDRLYWQSHAAGNPGEHEVCLSSGAVDRSKRVYCSGDETLLSRDGEQDRMELRINVLTPRRRGVILFAGSGMRRHIHEEF